MLIVCAANGRIGRRLVSLLSDGPAPGPIVAGVRDPATADTDFGEAVALKRVDYDSVEGMQETFAGAERVVFIPSYADTDQRAQQGRNVVAAAEAAGVKQLLFVGIMDTRHDSPLPFARAYGQIEDAIRGSSLSWVILRTSMYTDNLAEQYPMWLDRGELVTCAGDGAISYVSRDDIAASLAGVLSEPIETHSGNTYTLTGPEALTYADVAARIESRFNTSITVSDVSVDEFGDRLRQIWGLAYDGIEHVARVTPLFQMVFKEGLMSAVTDDVERLSGHAPETVEHWLARHD